MTTKHKSLPLNSLVSLMRCLEGRRWEDGAVRGHLTLSSQAQVALLQAVIGNPEDTPCQMLEGDPDEVVTGATFDLAFRAPRLGIGYLLPDLDTLLLHPTACAGDLGVSWYVVDRDWLSGERESDLARKYEAMGHLVELLARCADYYEKNQAKLVFLHDGRIDVPVRYGATELEAVNLATIEQLLQACGAEDGHTLQRRQILATAVREIVEDLAEDLRFKHLLILLPALLQNFHDGYRMFAASFSFEKVRDQLEAMRIEYTGRIHKALSDIQGQLLGIPVATIIVATQMKEAIAPGAIMWSNIAVLLGSSVFMLLLAAAIHNQQQTLAVLSQEVERQEAATRAEHADIAERFSEVFLQLRARLRWQVLVLRGMLAIGLLSMTFSFIVFWAMSKPAISVFF